MKQKMNFTVLREMDYLLTTSVSFLATGIRLRTAGVLNTFNMSIPTHAGCVVNIPHSDGSPRYFIAEMLLNGLRVNPLEDYCNRGPFGPRIVAVRRNPVYGSEAIRTVANERIIEDWHNTIKYDIKGIVEYLWPEETDRPNEFYCSELLQHYALLDGGWIEYKTKRDDDDIPPVGIFRAKNLVVVNNFYQAE